MGSDANGLSDVLSGGLDMMQDSTLQPVESNDVLRPSREIGWDAYISCSALLATRNITDNGNVS